MRCIALGCFSLLLFATTANADWLEISSDHFVIYGDQSERDVKDFAQRLELFHSTMAYLFARPQAKPGPSNRVTIFVVSNAAKVRKVTGAQNRYLIGAYNPGAGSSVAIIPKIGRDHNGMSGETVLLHEYAHHFMMATLTSRAFPRWFTEGFAEFFAGVRFREDGSVAVGVPARHRTDELVYAVKLPMRNLLTFDGGARDSTNRYDAFYGQSWMLFHYLQMAPDRKGQLSNYQRQLATGRSTMEAAESAFGDLDQLSQDLDVYMRSYKLSAMVVDGSVLTTGPITMRKLRPGEAAMMPVIIESKAGVTDEEAKSLVPEARKIAARHQNDAAVLAALAEAEFDAGNDDAAIAAADRAIAIDAKNINAHIQKGYALAHKAQTGASPKESWADARKQFIVANGVENDHPIPLIQFYLTYVKQGEKPTKNAIDGLEWAMQLAPFDATLRWFVVQQMISDERYKDAALTLEPLAYSPHQGKHTEAALRLLKEVEAKLEE
jgi:tetratricopeptide (TPR) repeat protein